MEMSGAEVAALIEDFLEGKGGAWDCDDFISIRQVDQDLERVRATCAKLPERFPPSKREQYCSEKGLEVLRDLLARIKGGQPRSVEPGAQEQEST